MRGSGPEGDRLYEQPIAILPNGDPIYHSEQTDPDLRRKIISEREAKKHPTLEQKYDLPIHEDLLGLSDKELRVLQKESVANGGCTIELGGELKHLTWPRLINTRFVKAQESKKRH